MRGRHCLEALAFPEQERVGSKFLNTHDKSFSSLRGRKRSVGGVTRTPVIHDSVGKCCSDNSSRKSDGGTVKGNTSPDGRRPRRRDVKRREADVDATEAI
jgi:hypothetical protein